MSSNILYHKILPQGEFLTYDDRPDIALTRVKQVHSNGIIHYSGKALDEVQIDGIQFEYSMLQSKKMAIAITTADCMPVLFLGKESAVFLHAGWRGLAGGILTNPLVRKINPYYAFIGPSIELEAFEVQKDFRHHFAQEDFYHEIDGKLHFDLQGKAVQDIHLAYPGIKIELAGECTHKLSKYNSWRRDKTDRRNWNIFTL